MLQMAEMAVLQVRRLLRRQEGAQLIEYLLVIAMVGAIVLAVRAFMAGEGNKIGNGAWDVINSWLNQAKAKGP